MKVIYPIYKSKETATNKQRKGDHNCK